MINELGKIQQLVVLSRTSVLRYRDTELPASRIASELGVDGLIEGSVFRAGDSVRINVQLVRADPERTLWTASYEGTLGEALGLHRRVAQAVAREVRVSLAAEESRRLGAIAPIPPAAQEAYLRGLAALRTRTLDGIDTSIVLLRDAVRLAPDLADGWGALAEAEWFWGAYHGTGLTPAAVDSAIGRARAAAGNALRIDDAQPAAMTVMAQAQWDPNDWDAVISGLRHTVEVNPNYAQAWNLLGDALGATGQLDEGLETHRRAQLLDPLHPVFSRDVAISLLLLGRYAAAEQEIRRALDLEPHVSLGRITLIQVLMLERKFDDAADEEATLLPYLGASAGLVDRFRAEFERGGWTGALTWLLELKPTDLPDAVGDPAVDVLALPGIGTAFALAWLGRTAEALDALERTFPVGDRRVSYRLWVKSHPFLASLRGEPRYREVLRRLRLDDP
jgi:tetratricopeptide (TPR) repeat protein